MLKETEEFFIRALALVHLEYGAPVILDVLWVLLEGRNLFTKVWELRTQRNFINKLTKESKAVPRIPFLRKVGEYYDGRGRE